MTVRSKWWVLRAISEQIHQYCVHVLCILNMVQKEKNILIIFQQYYPALVILRTEHNFETSSSLFMVHTPSHMELCPCSTSNGWMPLRWPLRDNRESQSTVLSGIPFLGLANPPRSLWKQDIVKTETCCFWHERLLSALSLHTTGPAISMAGSPEQIFSTVILPRQQTHSSTARMLGISFNVLWPSWVRENQQ